MDDTAQETPGRTSPRRFVVAVTCFGAAAVMFTHSAFSGDQGWQRDAYVAIALWMMLALVVADHFYCSKRSKSFRLMAAGGLGIGLGVFLVAGALLLQLPDVTMPMLTIVVGAFLIVRGIWSGRRSEGCGQ